MPSSTSCLPLPRRRRSSPPVSTVPQPPSRISRAITRVKLPFNQSDANSLAQHWKDLLENKEGDTESDRLEALFVTAPSLAARIVDCLLPLRRGESTEEWEKRVRREVKAEEGRHAEAEERVEELVKERAVRGGGAGGVEELHNAEVELYLSTKLLKYLEKDAPWAFPPRSRYFPLNRNAYLNSGPAWLDEQGGTRSRGRVIKGKERAE